MWNLMALAGMAASTLYGPVEVDLPLTTTGNPFDPEINDVRVDFVGPSGLAHPRLAHFSRGRWKVRAALPETGEHEVVLRVNRDAPKRLGMKVEVPKTPLHWIRVKGNRFVTSDGKPYWPLGHNLAWQSQNWMPMEAQMARMREKGLNWTRIWSCNWDDRNPWWLENKPNPTDGWLSEDALDRWELAVRAAEKNGLKFQFVFFNHGQFSSDVNPNWPQHPWNAKNGGFLKSAEEFFTDPEAKRRTKMFLRAAVARFGYSPSLMAWELWNEVQYVDLVRKLSDWKTIGAWHDEMARFIRSIDFHNRLITTSSELGVDKWREMDYLQGHGYPPSVAGMLLGASVIKGQESKPMFFGEIGFGGDKQPNEHMAIRDGIWAALLAGHAGAGQYWYWDRLTDDRMNREYLRGTEVLKAIGTLSGFQSMKLDLVSPIGGNLVVVPGRGWERSTKTDFNLAEDLSPSSLGQLSGYLQGQANRAMQKEPWRFRFVAGTPGNFVVTIGQAQRSGAEVVVRVNGKEVRREVFAPSDSDVSVNKRIEVAFGRGRQVVEIENVGADWVFVPQVEFSGLAPQVTGYAARSGALSVLRLQNSGNAVKADLGLANPGARSAMIYDLESRSSRRVPLEWRGNRASLEVPFKDQIVVIGD